MNLAGNDPEPLGLAFHHQGFMFINAKNKKQKTNKKKKLLQKMVIETEGNMGLMISAKALNHVWTYYKAYFAHLLILDGPKITEI